MIHTGKIGNISVLSIDFDTWPTSEQKDQPNIKKKKNNKKTIYPFLLNYSCYTEDIFWDKKFTLWSNGKLPKGFIVENENVYFIKNGKRIACEKTENPGTNTELCIDFFKKYANISSKKDDLNAINTNDSQSEESKEDIPISWKTLNKRNQELYIRMYVHDTGKLIDLNANEKNLLLQMIRLGIKDKKISKDNIIMADGKIREIKGIMWDEDARKFGISSKTK